jgi:hypothetical protein
MLPPFIRRRAEIFARVTFYQRDPDCLGLTVQFGAKAVLLLTSSCNFLVLVLTPRDIGRNFFFSPCGAGDPRSRPPVLISSSISRQWIPASGNSPIEALLGEC